MRSCCCRDRISEFPDDLGSLAEVRLNLKLWDHHHKPNKPIYGDVTHLAAGISNITTLHLSPDSLEGLVHRVTDKCGDACTCTPNNKHNKKNKKKSKTKVMSCLWTCQVKVLEILEYGGSFQELELMRHFLGKLECLETVRVGIDKDRSIFLRANLLSLPILSSNCNNIHFI